MVTRRKATGAGQKKKECEGATPVAAQDPGRLETVDSTGIHHCCSSRPSDGINAAPTDAPNPRGYGSSLQDRTWTSTVAQNSAGSSEKDPSKKPGASSTPKPAAKPKAKPAAKSKGSKGRGKGRGKGGKFREVEEGEEPTEAEASQEPEGEQEGDQVAMAIKAVKSASEAGGAMGATGRRVLRDRRHTT